MNKIKQPYDLQILKPHIIVLSSGFRCCKYNIKINWRGERGEQIVTNGWYGIFSFSTKARSTGRRFVDSQVFLRYSYKYFYDNQMINDTEHDQFRNGREYNQILIFWRYFLEFLNILKTKWKRRICFEPFQFLEPKERIIVASILNIKDPIR